MSALAFRLYFLTRNEFPPSGDAGGDLYLAHAWIGQGIPQISLSLVTPPLYFITVVIPATTIFGPFLGFEVIMAVLPAALSFPAYAFGRELGLDRPWALVASALLATSAPFSLMVTWNSGFNMFGIVLLVSDLTFVLRYFRTGSGGALMAAALGFMLVGLAHPLTFLEEGLTLALMSGLVLVSKGISSRGKRIGFLWINLFIATIPLLMFYLPEGQAVVVSHATEYTSQIPAMLSTALFVAWGGAPTFSVNPILLLDVVLTVAGIPVFASRQLKHAPYASYMLLSMIGGIVVLVVVSPGTGIRGIYFLTIPSAIFLTGALQRGYRLVRWRNHPKSRNLTGNLLQRRLPWGAYHLQKHPRILMFMTVALVSGIVLANVSQSELDLSSGIQFYKALTPSKVKALEWLRSNTPTGSVVFDEASMSTWIWGYAGRMAYAPAPLSDEVTQQSYDWAYQSDLVDAGTYLTGDSYLMLSHSYPAPDGTPAVYLASAAGWEPLMLSQTDMDTLNVTHAGSERTLGLQYTTLERATGQSGLSSASYDFALQWTSLGYGISENATIAGASAWMNWSGISSQNVKANLHFGMPPSGYFYDYRAVPNVANVTSVTDLFAISGSVFSMTLQGGQISQRTLSSGWTVIDINRTSALSLTLSGVPRTLVTAPFSTDTWTVLQTLDINYVVVDSSGNYAFALRLQAGALGGGLRPVIQYTSGSILIYSA